MSHPNTSLFRDHEFRLLFAASTLATFGASISQMALPLTAVELLHAGPREMGLLGAVELLPFALFSLPAGGWIDRSRKRRLGMIFDLLGCFALLLVPLAYMLDRLTLDVLYVAAFLVGCCYVVGGSSMQIFVAQLVGRDRLIEANSKIIAAEAAASVVGPAVAALLIGAVGAPLAVTANAAGFFLSFALLSLIKRDDPPQPGVAQAWWRDASDGLRFVWGSPILRGLAVVGALWIMLFDSFRALYVLFASRDLGFSAVQLGVVNAVGALGAMFGAIAARRFERRSGPRATLIGGYLLSFIGVGLYAVSGLAGWTQAAVIAFACMALLTVHFGTTLYTVTYISLRQKVTPDHLLGRMTATMRFITVSVAPLGSLIGGYAGGHFGLMPTLMLASGFGVLLALAAARGLPSTKQASSM
jgi:MFS family permease